jgi:hypothetical protein
MMRTHSAVATITPALTKDVSFTEKVEAVDTALKNRSAAQRDIKVKWAGVVKLLQKYDLTVPARRPDPATVVGYIRTVRLYKPQPTVPEDLRAVVGCEGRYELGRLREKPDMLKLLNEQFPGFATWLDKVREAEKSSYGAPKEQDEDATKVAQEEMSAAVDAYLASIEAYDDTLESVANVKEYIGIMKDIADISAIAQGIKPKE